MKKYMMVNFLLFSILISCSTLGCKGDSDKEIGGEIPPVVEYSNDDDGKPHPQGSFNYAGIAEHPRLLFSSDDEKLLKENIQKNRDLLALHEYVISQSKSMLNTTPVTRVMEGKRLLGVSRTALKRIFYLSYAYRMTGENAYLVRAEREINAVCEFTDWNPSHFLDVGEMALGVAIGYDWLYDKLDPKTRSNARKALVSKGFEPSKVGSYNWFLTNKANWNQVCNAGLSLAALAIYEGVKAESVEIIERCLESIKLPLEAYGPDGNYTEGYMYWSYGTDFQTLLLSSFETALGSDKNFHKTEGFMKTAEYMLYMSGTDGLCFNYADSYNNETPRPSMFWFARKSNNTSLLYKEKQMLAKGAYLKSFAEDRLLPMTLIYANMESFEHILPPGNKIWVGSGATPVAMVRTSWGGSNDQYVGVKAGKASESHGHMDAGSFVYDAFGIRWAADLGMQSYAPLEAKDVDLWNMGQDSQRWDIFRLGNKSHNTLIVNDKRHLVDGMSTITKVYDTDKRLGVDVDLTPVFKDDLNSAKRTITLIDEDYLSVDDIITTKNKNTTIRWNMLTTADCTIENSNTIRLTKNEKIMYFTVDSNTPVTLKTWSTDPVNEFDEANPGTMIIGFECVLPEISTYTFSVKLDHTQNR
ncbi:heparinase II/III family protein [uncultured Dysgonomonas sp.]|uniref:Heparinase II/III-like C-terminal domain-containing protein n=1 Tax=uncultured Dysgonomonas sp. TaxID=206096 RepID=A0A212K6W1_9BACT|nr:heparinase II/III family protein [uncultured Dysgonomonas sp.]SBW07440.1 conserved exported hypothetical protein [uncultured Dysgonomonas sp.]